MTEPSLKLRQVCSIQKGGLNPQLSPDEGFAHYSIPAFDDGMRPVLELGSAIKSQKTPIPQGAVLVSKLNPRIPRVWFVSDEQVCRRICSTEFVPFIPDTTRLLPEYLAFALRRLLAGGQITGNTSAATKSRERAKPSEIADLEIPVPPLNVQRRIVDLLARAEGIVRLRREAQQKAAELIPAVFIDMFGNPATNPRGWPMSAIERMCPVQTGATPIKEERRYYEGGTVPWVRTGEVQGRKISEVEERITELAIAETNCKVFPVDTILVAMYGQGQTRGRAGMLKTPAATNQACAAILPSDEIDPRFLFEALNLQYDRLRAMGRGGNQANLNLGMIKELQVPCPPMDRQLEFVERSIATESILGQQAAASEKAVAAFDALLSRAFG
jgi:type I restriction enzyme S subunit